MNLQPGILSLQFLILGNQTYDNPAFQIAYFFLQFIFLGWQIAIFMKRGA